MAFIGKLLIVVHGALSLAVLAWAFGIFTNRIDWNTPPVEAGQEGSPGLYAQQDAKVKQYNEAVDKAYTRWSGNLLQVQALENERYPRRAYYAEQLQLVKGGANAAGQRVQNPVRVQILAPNGYLDVRPNAQRPIFHVRDEKKTGDGTGVPAKAIDDYITQMAKYVEDIEASQVRNAQAIAEREKLNLEIVGKPPMKGLRTLLNEQQLIHDQAIAEDAYVVGFVTNREAEFGLLKKRRDAMSDRMKELDSKDPRR
jgi:hypothetical protein